MEIEMEIQKEEKSLAVLEAAKQDEEIRKRWSWVKPTVWTTRMLTALEEGVKGGIWFSLIDKVYSERTLRLAYEKVKANKGGAGVDHVTIEQFGKTLEKEIPKLSQQLKEGIYEAQAIRRVYIPKLGSKEKRPLGIPTVRDRVVQTALRDVIEPIFEKEFEQGSYGFRPGRGSKDALRQVDHLLRLGAVYVVDADLKSYFDTIPHERLMNKIKSKIADSRIQNLVQEFLRQGVMDEMQYYESGMGTPQGAVISPLLSNIYLHELDVQMRQRGRNMVRYADDLVVLCSSREEAQAVLNELEQWIAENALQLHPTKTKIVNWLEEGFEFLGYEFRQGKRYPRRKSQTAFRSKIRAKTHRSNGHSLSSIIASINPSIKGWFAYYKHSYKTTFPAMDGYIRMRLRSILRHRRKGRGRGRGADHQRWPNKFFQEQGLFSLQAAHALACQSSRR